MARDMRTNRLYRIYNNMLQRCSNPNNPSYGNYGGRGIYVTDMWQGPWGFHYFETWALANRYAADLDLDRFPDNDGPYSPSNCRWTTRKNNTNNTRKNLIASAFGEEKTLAQWSDDERCEVSRRTLYKRISAGVSLPFALTTPSAKGATA